MFIAKKLSKLFLVFMVGSMFGVALFHFISSLMILTRTTDLVLSKALSNREAEFGNQELHLRAHTESTPEAKLQLVQDPNGTETDILNGDGDDSFADGTKQGSVLKGAKSSVHKPTEKPAVEERTPHDLVLAEREPKRVNLSTMTISERERFQQAQVDDFCQRNDLNFKKLSKLGRHILIDKRSKTAFCFAPKVGCTNLKILFFITQGVVPSDQLFKTRDGVDQQKLEAAISELSLESSNRSHKDYVIENYYKFVMFRNPIERLFSAYRSKVQRFPMQSLDREEPHYNWLRMNIYEYKHPQLFKQWRENRGKKSVEISFLDFIDYWLHKGGLTFDEHFQSIYELCQPCQVRYSFYGNFNTFNDNAEVLIRHIGSDSSLLREEYYQEGEHTSDLAPNYYKSLSNQMKKLIVNKLAVDLSFYYTIFPSERDSHKHIMDIEYDVPIFDY